MAIKTISGLAPLEDPLTGDEEIPLYSTNKTYKSTVTQLIEELPGFGIHEYGPSGAGPKLDGQEELSCAKNGKTFKFNSSSIGGGEWINVRELAGFPDKSSTAYSETGEYGVLGFDDKRKSENRWKFTARLITKAINLASSKKKPGKLVTVYFPPGDYYINEPIVIKSSFVRLLGAGKTKSKIRLTAPVTVPAKIVSDLVLFAGEKKNIPIQGCGILGLSLVGDNNTDTALRLCNVRDFYGEELDFRAGQRAINIENSENVYFENITASVFLDSGQFPFPLAKIRVADTRRFYINKAQLVGNTADTIQIGCKPGEMLTGEKTSRYPVDKSTVYLSNIEMSTKGGRIIHLTGTGSKVFVRQCHLEIAKNEHVYQPDIADLTQDPARLVLMDCSFIGPVDIEGHPKDRGTVSILTPNDQRIRISHCNLEFRNSPGLLHPTFKAYLSLPAINKNHLGKTSVHIDCVGQRLDQMIAQDPSGIITGNVTRFVKRQKNRATRVEAFPTARSSYTAPRPLVLRYDLDLSLGGIKELSVSNPHGTEVSVVKSDSLVPGTEIILVLFNASNNKADISFPGWFRLRDGRKNPIELAPGDVEVHRFIYQPRLQFWTMKSFSPSPPKNSKYVQGNKEGGIAKLVEISPCWPFSSKIFTAYATQTSRHPIVVGENISEKDGSFSGIVTEINSCWI